MNHTQEVFERMVNIQCGCDSTLYYVDIFDNRVFDWF